MSYNLVIKKGHFLLMIYHFLTFTFSDNNLITVVKNIVLCFHRKLIQERFLINSVSVYN